MDRRVAAFSLIELVVTISVLGLLAIPFGGVTSEHLKASLQGDKTTPAANLARYEQERAVWLGFSATSNWCSDVPSQLPSSESWCPASVSLPNPYAGLNFQVTRQVLQQSPTDNSASSEMKLIIVKVFRSGETTPSATVITYKTNGVSFGT